MRLGPLVCVAALACEAPPQIQVLPAREVGPDAQAAQDAQPDLAAADAHLDVGPPDQAPDADPDAQPDGAPDAGPQDAQPDVQRPDADPLACDDADPRVGAPCQGFVGRCPTGGTLACEGADLRCILDDPDAQPERCNGEDDDCDGAIDERADAPCGPGAECAALACRCPPGRAAGDGDPDTGCELGCGLVAVRDGLGARVVPAGGLAGDRALVFAAADGLWLLSDGADQPAQVLPLPIDFSPVQAVAVPGPRAAAGVVGNADGEAPALWLADTGGRRLVIPGPVDQGVAAAAARILPDDTLVAAVVSAGATPTVQVYAQPWGAELGLPVAEWQGGGQPAVGAAGQVAVVDGAQTTWIDDAQAPAPVQALGFGGRPARAQLADGWLYAVGDADAGGARWVRWPLQAGALGRPAAGRLDMRQATGLMAGALGVAALGVGRDQVGTRMPVAQWFGAFGPSAALPVVDGANAIVHRARRFGAAGDQVAWIELDGQAQVRWARAPCGD